MQNIDLKDYDFHLPKELIAQQPIRPRNLSRLMIVNADGVEHRRFKDILSYFREGDVLVLNNTKVLPNKIYGKKSTGASANMIVEEKCSNSKYYRCRVQSRNPIIGTKYNFPGSLVAEIMNKEGDIFFVQFNKDPVPVLKKYGKLPTPNYVKGELRRKDHYQTTFSKEEGSLAAPTSGLHFTRSMLEALKSKGVRVCYVTLHISFGTFKPIDESKSVLEHKMDKEYYVVSKRTADVINDRKGRLIVCGTTSFKALESCSDKNGVVVPKSEYSDIFIYPGRKFHIEPDMMITNFHLPKSTLVLFVSAYFGKDRVLNAYNEAVREEYRFFSLGDATLFVK